MKQKFKEFWYKIKTLGRRKVKPFIPNEVKLEDGQISSDQTEVLNKLKNDFFNSLKYRYP